MSLRLVKPGLLAAFPTHPTKIDPRTGLPLVALGVGRRGPIWPVMGGAPSDDDEDEEGDEGEGGEEGGEDDKGEEDVDGLKARIKALEEEKDRHYKKRSGAEKELEALRKFKEEADNAGKSETDRLKGELEKAQAAHQKALDDNKKLRLDNAFLTHNSIKWHNPGEALKLADLSAVEIDADGVVNAKALKAALTNLANSSKHLVRSESDDGDDESGGANNGSGSGSGSKMNGRRKGTPKEEQPPSKAELAKKFPALNIQ